MNEAQMLNKSSYKVATTPGAIYASLGTYDTVSKLSPRSVLIDLSEAVDSPCVMLAPISDLKGNRLYGSIAPVYLKDINEETLMIESADLIAKNKVKVTFNTILQALITNDISFNSSEIGLENIESMINNDNDKTEIVLVLDINAGI